MSLHWKGFELPPIGTYTYLVWNPATRAACVVDAPLGAWQLLEPVLKAGDLRLECLLLTHGHWDHLAGIGDFIDQGIPVWAHRGDLSWIENPGIQAAFMPPGLDIAGAKVERFIAHAETVDLCGAAGTIRHVPGHSPGGILLHFPRTGMAFCGDAIFAGGVGRADLPGGDWHQLEQSIRTQIYTLPADTRLLPGHGPETTVARERAGNPFVRD